MNGGMVAALLGASMVLMLALRALGARSAARGTLIKMAAIWVVIIAGTAWIAAHFI